MLANSRVQSTADNNMTGLTSHYINISRSLLRIPTYLLLCLYLTSGVLLGVWLNNADIMDELSLTGIGIQFFLCTLIIAFWYMNGTALNDYADYEIDLINLRGDPDRPLVVGLADRQELKALATAYAFCAIGLTITISPMHTLVTSVLLFLNYSYSMKPLQISRRGGIAPLLLPLGYVALPYLLGFGLTGWGLDETGATLLGALYLQFVGRIILKDYRDVKGDAKHGKMTFLLRHGNRTVCTVSGTSIIISGLLILHSVDMGMLKFPLILLTAYSVGILLNLSQTTIWKNQKPLLAAFGRAMTGVMVALIASVTTKLWHFTDIEVLVLSVVMTGIYLWSAQSAYIYNMHKLGIASKRA